MAIILICRSCQRRAWPRTWSRRSKKSTSWSNCLPPRSECWYVSIICFTYILTIAPLTPLKKIRLVFHCLWPDFISWILISQLNQNKWDKEKLLEAYYTENSVEKSNQSNPAKGKTSKTGDLVNCDICITEGDVTSTTSLECNHAYCNSCWSDYLTTKIMDEGASQTIACPANDCDILVDDQTVYRLIKEPEVRLKYQVTCLWIPDFKICVDLRFFVSCAKFLVFFQTVCFLLNCSVL